MIVLSSHGEAGFGPGGAYTDKNHLHGILIDAFHLLGLHDVRCIGAEYDEMHGELHDQSVRDANNAIEKLVNDIARAEVSRAKRVA